MQFWGLCALSKNNIWAQKPCPKLFFSSRPCFWQSRWSKTTALPFCVSGKSWINWVLSWLKGFLKMDCVYFRNAEFCISGKEHLGLSGAPGFGTRKEGPNGTQWSQRVPLGPKGPIWRPKADYLGVWGRSPQKRGPLGPIGALAAIPIGGAIGRGC